MRLLSVFQMVNMCKLVFSVQHNYICAQTCLESYPGTSTPSKTHKKPSSVLIFTGGSGDISNFLSSANYRGNKAQEK